MYKKVAGHCISTRLIEWMQEKAQVERVLLREITLGEAWLEEKEAYKKYMAFKRDKSHEARDRFLEELADAIAKEGGG